MFFGATGVCLVGLPSPFHLKPVATTKSLGDFTGSLALLPAGILLPVGFMVGMGRLGINMFEMQLSLTTERLCDNVAMP